MNTESFDLYSPPEDFIENVYEKVKIPLTFICDNVNIFSGNQETNLENSLEDVNPINHRLIENE